MTTQQVAHTHTPGPWYVSGLHGNFDHVGVEFSYTNSDGNRHEGSICLLDMRGRRAEANARLIAAAPELLACLKEALELIQEDIDNRDGRDNFGMCCGRCDGAIPVEHSFGCRAKAAISKAEHGQ